MATHSHSRTHDPFFKILEFPTGSQPVGRKKKSWKMAEVSGARLDMAHSTPSHIHWPDPNLGTPPNCLVGVRGELSQAVCQNKVRYMGLGEHRQTLGSTSRMATTVRGRMKLCGWRKRTVRGMRCEGRGTGPILQTSQALTLEAIERSDESRLIDFPKVP